jgi:ferritin-like metal-binding protein YciE
MAIQTPEDLFLYELSAALDAERTFAQLIPMLANAVRDDRVQDGLMAHERETQRHIRNLDQAIDRLGASPMPVRCHAAEGMRLDFEAFRQQRPSPEALALHALGAAVKTEFYEIATYRGLVAKAELMGVEHVARLLRENLQQEEAAGDWAEQVSLGLGQALLQNA